NSTRRDASLLSLAELKDTPPAKNSCLTWFFCCSVKERPELNLGSSKLHMTHSERRKLKFKLYKYEPSVSVKPSITICLNHFSPSGLFASSRIIGTIVFRRLRPTSFRR